VFGGIVSHNKISYRRESALAPASSSLKASDFGTNRNPAYSFLLVNNTNVQSYLARFSGYRRVTFSLSTGLHLSLTCSFMLNPWTHEHEIWGRKSRTITLL